MTVVRGATSVHENSKESIKESAALLFDKILENNPRIRQDGGILCIFASHTKDLTAYNTCTALREHFCLSCALECFQEADIEGSLPRIIRLSVFCNGTFEPHATYLGEARKLRPDLDGAS